MAINGFKADGTTYRYNAEALDGYAPIEDGSITEEKLGNDVIEKTIGWVADQSTANQTDATIETLVENIIADATDYGIHPVGGSWKNHSGGYNGYVVKRKYGNTTDAWEGQITASAGGAWAFTKTGTNASYITAIDSADAVRLYTGAAGLWMGKLSNENSLAFYSAAYPSGANLLGTLSLGLGTIISDTLTTATPCANSSFLNAATIAHEAGTYVIVGYASFASNASGTRSMLIASSPTGSSAIVTSARARVAPVTGFETTFGCSGILKATAAGTWYLRVWQNSGSALNVTGAQLTAIKIAD